MDTTTLINTAAEALVAEGFSIGPEPLFVRSDNDDLIALPNNEGGYQISADEIARIVIASIQEALEAPDTQPADIAWSYDENGYVKWEVNTCQYRYAGVSLSTDKLYKDIRKMGKLNQKLQKVAENLK